MKQPPFSIAAFWRNDRDDGIGVTFQGGDLGAIERKLANAQKAMDDPDHEHSAIMLAQLAYYASRKDQLTYDEQVEAACLIAALQHHGVIIADNYNGLMILREVVAEQTASRSALRPRDAESASQVSNHSVPDGQHRTVH